jgi:hypothetical protein
VDAERDFCRRFDGGHAAPGWIGSAAGLRTLGRRGAVVIREVGSPTTVRVVCVAALAVGPDSAVPIPRILRSHVGARLFPYQDALQQRCASPHGHDREAFNPDEG